MALPPPATATPCAVQQPSEHPPTTVVRFVEQLKADLGTQGAFRFPTFVMSQEKARVFTVLRHRLSRGEWHGRITLTSTVSWLAGIVSSLFQRKQAQLRQTLILDVAELKQVLHPTDDFLSMQHREEWEATPAR